MGISIRLFSRTNQISFQGWYTALTVPVLIVSYNFGSAAQANEHSGRGEVLRQFKIDNPDLSGKTLNQEFKMHWRGLNEKRDGASGLGVQPPIIESMADTASARPLVRSDFGSKAEFQAYKASFKEHISARQINQSIQMTETNKTINVNHGFSLDLSSTVDSITLGNNLFKQQESVIIEVGGQQKTLVAGSKVTAAEYVAAKQVLSGSAQTVVLGGDGRATGGNVDLSAMTTGNHNMKLNDLVVPVSVTASGDFAKGGDVRIKGDLINDGLINVFSAHGKDAALIMADSITNSEHASITSAVNDLTLAANDSFANFGTISASGTLTISGGNSVTNAGTVSAHDKLNINAPIVTNTGTLLSSRGDISFDAPLSNLSVENSGGVVSALNGAINIRNGSYDKAFSSTVTGGDLLSKELNVFSGGGAADVFVNQLTGTVNTSGTAAHVSADTSVLRIGNQCLIGDPTYFNTGDIVLDGDIVVGEDLAIIAGGNITATSNLSQIVARNVAGQGFDINIIAGANITGSPTGATPNPLPGQTTTPLNISGNATSSVTINGADFNGGNVDLSGASSTLSIESNSSLVGANAGSVSIVAFSAGGTGGVVNLPSGSNILASSNGGVSGDVAVLAGTSVNMGSVNNAGGASGGDVIVSTAGASSSNGLPITFSTLGAITSGNFLTADDSFSTGNLTVRDIFAGRNLDLFSAGAISALALSTTSGNLQVNNKFASSVQGISVSSTNSAMSTNIVSFGNINIAGSVTSVLNARIDNASSPGQSITIGGLVNGQNSGVVLETGAFGTITLNSTVLARRIAIGTNTLNLPNINALNANADGSGNGGEVSVVAGSISTSDGTLALNAVGTLNGNGGLVTLTLNNTSPVVVSSTGQFKFDVSAQGAGSGGSVVGLFGGDVTIDTNGIMGTGAANGGAADIRANGNVSVNAGGINLSGTDGDGAHIRLVAGADGTGSLNLNSTAFLSQANATGANNDGGSLNFSSEVINFAGSHLTLQAIGTGNGNGGFVGLNLGAVGIVNVSSAGLYSFDVSAPGSGNGGTVDATFGGSVALGAGAVIGSGGGSGGGLVVNASGNLTVDSGSINLAGTNGSGAEISLNAGVNSTGLLTLNDTAFLSQANATGANGDGGALVLSGASGIGFASSLTSPLVLSADGIGTGNGGLVSYRSGSSASTYVINPASISKTKGVINFLSLSAKSGVSGGDGGHIDIAAGGALTVDPAFMTAGPQSSVGDWDGAFYSLQSGTVGTRGSALVVQGSISADAVNNGFGGGIVLSSKSSTVFSVNSGAVTRNGIVGNLSASGATGSIVVNNGLGGIKVVQNGAMNAPSLMLSAGARGAILTNAGVAITASNDLTLIAGGAIGGKVSLIVNTPNLVAQSNGVVGITSLSPSTPIIVHDSFGNRGFTLTTNSDTKLFDITTTAGSIVVTQNGGSLLEVVDAGLLTANGGGITLQNNNTISGSIRVGSKAIVQTLGRGKAVNIVFGPVVRTGTNPVPPGTAPAGVTPLFSGRGVIYFGAAGTVTSEGSATVNAKGVNVVFNTVNNRPIILGDQSLIFADPPVSEPKIASAQTAFRSSASMSAIDSSALSSISAQNAIGVVEGTTFAADPSVQTLNTSLQTPIANMATLMTATNSPLGAKALQDVQDNDHSYAIGFGHFNGEADGVICTDSETLASQLTASTSVGLVKHASKVPISSGIMLVVPLQDTVVEAPAGKVYIGAKATVLVAVTSAGFAVYDIDDRCKDSVVVESHGHRLSLSPGRHAMITPYHKAEFAQVNAVESIAHRNVMTQLKNGLRAHVSEFSLISAMDTVKPLRALVKCCHPQGKQAAAHMLKTAAVLLHLRGGGQFQHYFKPRVTAMK